jgi:hypothetical protein
MLKSILTYLSPARRRLRDIRGPVTPPRLRVCPECAGPLVRASGCLHCAHCGWGHCG